MERIFSHSFAIMELEWLRLDSLETMHHELFSLASSDVHVTPE